MANLNSADLILVIISLFLPPVTAVLTDGCGGQFCLNVLLTLLGFLPGLVHAIWLVFRKAEKETREGLRGPPAGAPGRYDNRPIYVQQPGGVQPQQVPPPVETQPNYGTVPQHPAPGAKV